MYKITLLSLLLVVGMMAKGQGGMITFPSSNLPIMHLKGASISADTIPVIILYSDTSKQVINALAIPFGSMDSARNIDVSAYDARARWIFGYGPRHIEYGNQDCINCPHSWMVFDGAYLDTYKQPLPKQIFVWMAQQIPQPDTVLLNTFGGGPGTLLIDSLTTDGLLSPILRGVNIDPSFTTAGGGSGTISVGTSTTFTHHMPTQLTVRKNHKTHKWVKKTPPLTKD